VTIDPTAYSFLHVDVDDGIAFVTLDNRDHANSVDESGHREFGRILRDIAADPDVKVGVVHGAGKAFSVGATYDWMDQLTRDADMLIDLQEQVRELVRAHIDLPKPMVSAINGPAAGSGMMFALLCDWVIVEEHAPICDGHIKAAIAAGDGGAMIWPLTVGITRAKRWLMTGDWLSADEAERIGLVTEVVATGTSLARATEVARRFAEMPQMAVRYTKQALNQWLAFGAGISFDYSAALEMQTFALGAAEVREKVDAMRAGTFTKPGS
jgi:enoyl-CoA hydratase/carnithine racemase